MMGALLAADAGDDPISAAVRAAPIELRKEDSLRAIAAPIRKASAAMAGMLIGSFAIHVALLGTAVITGRVPTPPPQQEIAVDVVQDVPKPADPPKPAKPDAPAKPAKPDAPAKPAPALKPAPPPAAAAPVDTPKAPVKPPDVQQAKLAAPAPSRQPPPAPPRPQPAAPPPAEAKELEALQKELSDLRAQRAALTSAPQTQAAPQAGPLTGSLQAVAMPSIGVDGEVTGYQELVFSQLAKAKGDGEYRGQAGTTGVHFELDAKGQLLRVEIAASSGSPALDAEALDIVHRAAPFPPPPKDADHSFFANVNFRPPKA